MGLKKSIFKIMGFDFLTANFFIFTSAQKLSYMLTWLHGDITVIYIYITLNHNYYNYYIYYIYYIYIYYGRE